jgi:hypothetical protein
VRGVRRGQPCQPLRRPRPGALPTVHAAPAIPHRRRPTGLTRRSRLRPAARRQVRVAASAAVAMGTWRTAGMPRSIQAITTVAVGLAAVAIGRPALMADLPTVMPGPRVGPQARPRTGGACPLRTPGVPASTTGFHPSRQTHVRCVPTGDARLPKVLSRRRHKSVSGGNERGIRGGDGGDLRSQRRRLIIVTNIQRSSCATQIAIECTGTRRGKEGHQWGVGGPRHFRRGCAVQRPTARSEAFRQSSRQPRLKSLRAQAGRCNVDGT